MRKFITAVLTGVVLSLGVFASMASAGNGNGNGSMPKGGTNTCQPGYHEAGGTCVHNGDGGGNCGQNQSGDMGNGNGSNQGNGGDKGYGHRPGCGDTPASPPPPPVTTPPVTPPVTTPPATTPAPSAVPESPAAPSAAPAAPPASQTPATVTKAKAAFKPPVVKHRHKVVKQKVRKHHAAKKGVKALMKTAKAPRK